MNTPDIKLVLDRLREVEARVRTLEHHVRGTTGHKCARCGELSSYSVGVARSASGQTNLIQLRCAMCGHEDATTA